MQFRMSDIPFADPKVAGAVIRCLQKCGHAFDDVLTETKEMMPESEWNLLRRGVGQIMGSDMFDMWAAIVKLHPQFERDASGK